MPHRRQRHGAVFLTAVYLPSRWAASSLTSRFYDTVFAEIGEDYRAQSIMIGDSPLKRYARGGRMPGSPTSLYGRTEPDLSAVRLCCGDPSGLPALRRCDEPVRAQSVIPISQISLAKRGGSR